MKRFVVTIALAAASIFTLSVATPAYACGKDCDCAKKSAAEKKTADEKKPAEKAAPAAAPAPAEKKAEGTAKCECSKGGKGCTCPKGECKCANCGQHASFAAAGQGEKKGCDCGKTGNCACPKGECKCGKKDAKRA